MATQQRDDWGLLLSWAVATTLGWVVGFTICDGLKTVIDEIHHISIIPLSGCLPVDGAVIGVCVGIAQWLVLRPYIAGTRWWIAASIVGFAIGKQIGDYLVVAIPGTLGAGLSGAVIGTLAGIAQWFVLRHYAARAGWWIAASALAWAIGWSVISLAEAAENELTVMAYGFGVVGTAIAGVITAAALIRLFNRTHLRTA